MYFARLTFRLDAHHEFKNLSNSPINIFSDGDATCAAHIEKRGNRNVVILEYGGFQTRDAANIAGVELMRNIKIQMVEHEVPVNISGGLGILDTTNSVSTIGGFTEYGKNLLRCGGLFGLVIPDDVAIENDYIGLRVFEVNESLKEIRFFAQSIEATTTTNFTIDYHHFLYWDRQMDISLSLLNASVSINDIRIKFLLRLMSIEVLVAQSEYRDTDYLSAIEQLQKYIDGSDIRAEYKSLLKSQLGSFREKSVSQKVTGLLEQYLSDMSYEKSSPKKFFSLCYKGRSSFVHNGVLEGIDISAANASLKRMSLDLLYQLSIRQK